MRRPRAAVEVRVEGLDADPLLNALAALGIRVKAGASLRIVVANDYLNPELAVLNATAMADGTPWLMAKPFGERPWIGPLFVPGKTACWQCLADRLRSNGWSATSTGNRKTTSEAIQSITATEAAKWLLTGRNDRLQGQIRVFDSAVLEIESHQVTRRPQCPTCGGTKYRARRARGSVGRSRPPEETVKILRRHVSPLTGIVSEPERIDAPGGLSGFAASAALVFSPNHAGSHLARNPFGTGGIGWTEAEAKAACLAEAVERYSVVFHGDERRITACFAELKNAAVDPRSLMQFSDDQYRKRAQWNRRYGSSHRVPEPFDPDAQIEWVELRSLTSRARRYVPAAYCYLGYGAPYCAADTNGCAAGNTWEEAVLHGLLELIERDSVALWWYNRVPRPAVDVQAIGSPRMLKLVETIRGNGRRLRVLDVTTDSGIPAVVALSSGRIGSGAGLTIETASRQALLELVKAEIGGGPRLSRSAWLPTSKPGHSTLPRVKSLEACLKAITRLGLEAYALDMTRPEIGFPVARVIVPGLRHWYARYAPGRLYEAPVAMGWIPTKLTEKELNPTPFVL